MVEAVRKFKLRREIRIEICADAAAIIPAVKQRNTKPINNLKYLIIIQQLNYDIFHQRINNRAVFSRSPLIRNYWHPHCYPTASIKNNLINNTCFSQEHENLSIWARSISLATVQSYLPGISCGYQIHTGGVMKVRGAVTVFWLWVMMLPILIGRNADAASYYVPDNFATIQAAINAAADNDVIMVRPGVYQENLTIQNKNITVQSTDGAASTTIDGGHVGPVVKIIATAAGYTGVLDGFTVTNGQETGSYNGGGIVIDGTSPTIKNSVITGNNAPYAGGGIAITNYNNASRPTPLITNCSIVGNTAGGGGGLWAIQSDPTILKSRITDNVSTYGGGGVLSGTSNPPPMGTGAWLTIKESYISRNRTGGVGGGIGADHGNIIAYNNVIDFNTAGAGGGGVGLSQDWNSTIGNNTISNNSAPVGGGFYQSIDIYDSTLKLYNNISYGNSTPHSIATPRLSAGYNNFEGSVLPGGSNISADPLFVNGAAGNYKLRPGSPSIDTGASLAGYGVTTDILGTARPQGTAYDMGAYEWVSGAQTYYVPDNFATIQAAINAADVDDIIMVRPGVYQENLTIQNMNLTIQSTDGAATTIIDGGHVGPVVKIIATAAGYAGVLDGFTVTNGQEAGGYNGGGIVIDGASPTIKNSVITGNNAPYAGGGIAVTNFNSLTSPKPLITNCSIVGNTAGGGGGLWAIRSEPTIEKSRITDNVSTYGGGGVLSGTSDPLPMGKSAWLTIKESYISRNRTGGVGGGIGADHGNIIAYNNVIDFNTAGAGGGIGLSQDWNSTIGNNTISNNSAPVGGGFYQSIDIYDSTLKIYNNISYGNSTPHSIATPRLSAGYNNFEGSVLPGWNNISADPLFVNGAAGDYKLRPGSPSIDTGASIAGYGVIADILGTARPQGTAYDMGAYEWVDNVAPVTTITKSGTAGQNGWYVSAVTLNAAATDYGTGVKETHCNIDGTETVTLAGAPITKDLAEGIHSASCYSIDNAGNTEATAPAISVSIDTTAPVTTATITGGTTTNGWYKNVITVNLTGADTLSGVKEIHYAVNGGAETIVNGGSASIQVSAQGANTIVYYAIDRAGNIETSRSINVPIDTIPPVTTATPSGTVGTNGWYKSAVTLAFTSSDITSGVKEIHYAVNGGAETVISGATASFVLSTQGVNSVTFYAVDLAGNVEQTKTVSLSIDTVLPATTAAAAGTMGTNGIYKSAVTISFSATDAVSGVKEIRYSINGGTETVVAGASASVQLTATGTYSVAYYAVDKAGNIGTQGSMSITIDVTAPVVSSTSPANKATGVLTTASITVTFSENIASGTAYSNITLKKGTTTVTTTKTIAGKILTIKPTSALSKSSGYTVTIPANAVVDAAGNNITAAYTFTFTTGSK